MFSKRNKYDAINQNTTKKIENANNNNNNKIANKTMKKAIKNITEEKSTANGQSLNQHKKEGNGA